MKYLKVFEEAKIKWYNKGKLSPPEESEDIGEHNKMIIYNKQFTNFLIKYEAYDDYLYELEKRRNVDITNENEINYCLKNLLKNARYNEDHRHLIDVSFCWDDTRERQLWSDLHNILISSRSDDLFENAKVKWYNKGKLSPPEESEDIKTHDRMIIYSELFTNFLIKHEAYDDFLDELEYQEYIDVTDPKKIFNHLNQRLIDDGYGDIRNLIDVSLIWDETKDPYKWEYLDRELKYAYNNNLFEEAQIKWYNNKNFSEPENSDFDPSENKDIIYDDHFTRFLITHNLYDPFVMDISYAINKYKSSELRSIEHINDYIRSKFRSSTSNVYKEIICNCISWSKKISNINWEYISHTIK